MSLAIDLLRNAADRMPSSWYRAWSFPRRSPSDLANELALLDRRTLDWSDDLARLVIDDAHPGGVRRLLVEQPILQMAIGRFEQALEWDAWRRAGEVAVLIVQGGDPEAAEKLLCCHDPQSGFIAFCPADFAHYHKFHPERCWLRICPSCAKAIAQRLRFRYTIRIETVMAQRVPGWSLKHLVLTVRREGDLRQQIRLLHRAAKRLFKFFWAADKRAGAFAALEIGPRGGNVHVHVILYGGFVAQRDLSDYWNKLTGNPVVFIRQINPEKAVAEGIKYCAKFANDNGADDFALTSVDLVAVHFALKGKRRVWSWGAFYGVDDDIEKDDWSPEVCPECHHAIAWLSRRDERALLHSTRVINCSVRTWSAALATGPPGALG